MTFRFVNRSSHTALFATSTLRSTGDILLSRSARKILFQDVLLTSGALIALATSVPTYAQNVITSGQNGTTPTDCQSLSIPLDGCASIIVLPPSNGPSIAIGGHLIIGSGGGNGAIASGVGTLQASAGGEVNTNSAYLGFEAGSSGLATIDGVGTAWTNTLALTVGSYGSGVLGITNGATVNDASAFVGRMRGAMGAVTVSDAGSVWNNSGALNLGYGGNGVLTVANGAIVSDATAQIGYLVGASGTATITGTGSAWNSAGTLAIGNFGHGNLTIAAGGAVSASGAYIANMGGSTGTATVSGTGSTLTASQVYVGRYGDGILTIDNGGRVNSGISVAYGQGSTGTVNLTGPGSQLNGVVAFVGYNGRGTFNISNGAVLNGAPTVATSIGATAGSTGRVTVVGAGSAWNNLGAIYIGATGYGALDVLNGATVNDTNGIIGSDTGTGAATVLGTGSRWFNSAGLYVGQTSVGSLIISNGGRVDNVDAFMSLGAGIASALTVSGTGSTWVSTGNATIGSRGVASLIVSDGASVSDVTAAVGSNATGSGNVTVTGAGSTWSHSNLLNVGVTGTGSLMVSNGAVVNSASQSNIGYASGSHGFATVTGNGSQWNVGTNLNVGGASGSNSSGVGTLWILAGGKVVSNATPYIGYLASANGTVTIDGPGSILSTPIGITVGNAGTGTLTLSNGGAIASVLQGVTIAAQASAVGTINIGAAIGEAPRGAGFISNSTVTFGAGTATLNFNASDAVTSFSPILTSSSGSSGIINVLSPGTTEFSSASTGFRGQTYVQAGTLLVNGAFGTVASTVTIAAGASLGGSGSIGGAVTVAAGGIVTPGGAAGTSVGTLSTGPLTLNAGSILNFDLGQAALAGGALNDLIKVNGALTLAGTLNVTESAGGKFGPGTYTLLTYTGALTNNGLALGSLPAGSINAIQTSVANRINLINTAGLTLAYWDGVGPASDSLVQGGTGTWQSAGGNTGWTNAAGAGTSAWTPDAFAVFGSAPGTVAVDDSLAQVSVSGMQFSTNGYVVTGNAISLAAGKDIIRVGDGTAAGASYAATIEAPFIGFGGLAKTDLGLLVLTGDNSYAGNTFISGGMLQLGNGGTSGSVIGTVVNDATLAFNRSDVVNFAGQISGTGGVMQLGSGVSVLTSTNSYTGGTTITAGGLQIGSGGLTGSILGNVVNNGTFTINRSGSVTFPGVISGNGTFTKVGSGTVILTGNSSYSGGTTITAGTLQIGGGGTSGSIVGPVTGNGALVVNRLDAIGLTGVINGTGTFTQAGLGVTTLTANNSYTGATTVSSGTLIVNGDQTAATGAVTVASGATLSGSGTMGGDVTVQSGATLSPGGVVAGSTIGPLTTGSLTLLTGSHLNFEMGQAGAPGGTFNDLVAVNGNLTLAGTLNVSPSIGGTFGPGLYRLITYTGALTDNGVVLGLTLNNMINFVQTNIPGQVNLFNGAGQNLTVWNGGPSDFWNIDPSNKVWTGADGAATAPWPVSDYSYAIFNGAGGTVTTNALPSTMAVTGMQFATTGYTIAGGPISLLSGLDTIRVGDGSAAGAGFTATVASQLGSSGTLIKQDLGTLVLSSPLNSYRGGTIVEDGTLSVSEDANLGAITAAALFGPVALNGGTLATTASFVSARPITLGNGAFAVAADTTLQLTGTVVGDNLLTTGAGVLQLAGINNYTGATNIRSGTLALAGTSSIASSAGVADNGVFDISGTTAGASITTLSGTGLVVLGAQNLTLTAAADTFAGMFAGSGGLALTAGTETLSGASTGFTGAATVNNAILTVNGTLGSGAATMKVGTGATLKGSGTVGAAVTVANGGIVAAGSGGTPGVLTLGALTLEAGATTRFALPTPNVTGAPANDLINVAGNLTLGGTLEAAINTAGFYRLFNYGGTVTGQFATTTFTGFQPVSSQILTDVPGQVNLAALSAGQQLQFWDGSDQNGNGLVDGGAGTWNAAATNWTGAPGSAGSNDFWHGSVGVFTGAAGADITVVGVQAFDTLQFSTGGYAPTGGTLEIAPFAGNAGVINIGSGATTTISSTLADGTGTALTKAGDGTLILSGINSYTGITTIEAGTLVLSGPGTLGTVGSVTRINGGVLDLGGSSQVQAGLSQNDGVITNGTVAVDTFNLAGGLVAPDATINAATAFTLAAGQVDGTLTGTGTLNKIGAGTVILAGANTYGGGTTIDEGTLQFGNGSNTGSITGAIVNNGTLALNRSDDFSFGGNISGTGSVAQRGRGSARLANNNSYTGGTSVDSGTLIGSASSFGMGTIVNNAALVINQASDAALANALDGTGSFTKTGSGALNLTADSGLSGQTTLEQGQLAVNARFARSAVTAQGGTTVSGTGTVGGLALQNGAVLAPGNAGSNGGFGTLTVAGNVQQQAGSIYQVQLAASGVNDSLIASGSVAIANGARLNVTHVNGQPYALNTAYTIVSAAGGVTGRYTLTGDASISAFVDLAASYDNPNSVVLRASQARRFNLASNLLPNQNAAANAVQSLATTNPLFAAIAFLGTDAEARNAFNQLSGELHSSAKASTLEDSRFVREAVYLRLRGSTGGLTNNAAQDGAVEPGREGGISLWGHGFGSWGHIQGQGGNTSELNRSIGGLFAGADAALGENWRLGALGGYGRSKIRVNGRSSTGETDNYHLGAYVGGLAGPVAVRLGGAYTWHKFETSRSVAFTGFADNLDANYKAQTAQAFGELSHRFDVHAGAWEPFAQLAYIHLHTKAFTERGGAAALTGTPENTNVTFSTLGLRAMKDLSSDGATTLYGSMGWRRAFGDRTPVSNLRFVAGGDAFVVTGTPIVKDAAVFEGGINRSVAAGLNIAVAYSGQISNRLQDHGIKAVIGWKF